ncbi:hypothetical protein WP50_14570 [Lactiplantibacillus plantarum]|nr:hypothetical protein WP50_14570 [Lactiplantibacillus plantarum]
MIIIVAIMIIIVPATIAIAITMVIVVATTMVVIPVIPLKMYLKHGFAKVLIGVAHGKREYDKRQDIKKREQQRQIDRVMKHY